MAKLLKQYGALPVMEVSGTLRVLLITSCVTHRWIIPKGHPEEKMRPGAEAVLKALEGAGVSGGRYRARRMPGLGQTGALGSHSVPAATGVSALSLIASSSLWNLDGSAVVACSCGIEGYIASVSPPRWH
jgi:hypothetical protein